MMYIRNGSARVVRLGLPAALLLASLSALSGPSAASALAPPEDPGRIVGDYNGRCLDADGFGTKGANGAIVQMWDCNSNKWQRWVATGDGHIKSRYDGRCLDADGGGGTRDQLGAIVQMWDCNNNPWQKWTIGADRKIHSQYNGRCLDADRNATKDQQGALVQLWDCNTNPWQSWPNSLFRLGAGETLNPAEALVSGDYTAEMQTDGNLVVYGPGHTAQWSTNTFAAGPTLEMQGDGNLVLYGSGHVAQWATGTGQGGAYVDMQSDGNLVVYAPGRVAVWASRSAGNYALPLPRSSVSVASLSRPHHDYAAVDIAVGAGTPFYAVTSGTVSTVDNAACGWGLRISGDDGAQYTYCHASRRDVTGGRVGAGRQLGLSGGVPGAQGSGDATGPHLHLDIAYNGMRCPQPMLVALYDNAAVPGPASLPAGGCSY
ncbi:RICIN domain-containing protein [Dactylosporangium vinaceum]|uniref:Ricin-type beta-trefoil lectin domain protein n=1 Tax=Dactylosporangium vinaceum TaxID=53362 RepID=A0ABV5M938_9ACTN|nr:ricin-type beta-trefoil lectin domain protein [Dactylosporangium vinaceum]UAB99485.1 RICIN domain-containing protein [Dactylosporangium vinaceum]